MFQIPETYELLKTEALEEIASTGYLLRHKKSQAVLALVENEDDNKVFSIGFRTPPKDSTGVAHIIEHSVLCGSKKYPVKDPFVELLKTSLNTFLNAMTYPDKTVYPVASCNDRDFANLMDVYLDAVFYPNIYTRPEIFRQEGWHYELESADSDLAINGVVYSEMKGAFSSPDEVAEREVLNSLFPDTPYGVESGGDPANIPDLTYEAFLDFHRKYYHPSNSYIYLYGDMDFAERLTYLDREYLSAFDAIEVDSEIPMQQAFAAPVRAAKVYPVSGDDEEGGSYLSWNMVCGDALNVREVQAMSLLETYLLGSAAAPVKKALQEAGIGTDVLGGYDHGLLQPYFSIIAKGARADQEEEFLSLVRSVLEKIVAEGADHEALHAMIRTAQFSRREADFAQFPKGLMYGLDLMDSWLYDKSEPFLYMHVLKAYEELDASIEQGAIEQMIQKMLLNNPHSSILRMDPEPGLETKRQEALAKRLADYKATLSDDQIQKMVEDTAHLVTYQSEESTPEELATLPKLSRKDIRRSVRPIDIAAETCDGIEVLTSEVPSNGILYIQLMFDALHVPFEETPYLKLLSRMAGRVNTENYDYGTLETKSRMVLGSIATGLEQFNRTDESKRRMFYTLSARLMEEDLEKAMPFVEEHLLRMDFSDAKRLHTLIDAENAQVKNTLLERGNAYAQRRLAAHISIGGRILDACAGIGYVQWLQELADRFAKDEAAAAAELADHFARLQRAVLCREHLTISVGGSKAGCAAAKQQLLAFADQLGTDESGWQLGDVELITENEGIATASAVQYVGRAGNYLQEGFAYNGSMHVARTILGLDYFWIEVRVKGTAYGCSGGMDREGNAFMVSYRDPQLARTIEIFDKTGEYLRSFDADEETMEGFLIGTAGSLDTPLTPTMRIDRAIGLYYAGISEEQLQKERDEMLDTTAEDIRALADLTDAALSQGCLCVVGSESAIEENKDRFDRIWHL